MAKKTYQVYILKNRMNRRFIGKAEDAQAEHTAHNKGQFKGTDCSKCHAEAGSKKKLSFNHQKDSRFKLTGFHLELEKKNKCEKCHPRGKYRTGKIECAQCHKDSHKKELGDKCGRCHATFPSSCRDNLPAKARRTARR